MKLNGIICALLILHCIALHAVINLARLSEVKELPLFQNFRSTVTPFKFFYAWGKILSTETLLGDDMSVACIERQHL